MRDPGKTYISVGLPIGDISAFYANEARERGVKLPTHIYQLLKERYDAKVNGIIWSYAPMAVQPQAPIDDSSTTVNAEMIISALGGEDE